MAANWVGVATGIVAALYGLRERFSSVDSVDFTGPLPAVPFFWFVKIGDNFYSSGVLGDV